MFKRTKSEATTATTAQPVKEGGKGRPTPKRKEAEAAAKARAKTPRTKRELALAQRQQRSSATQRARQAMRTGDERYLPPRDKGPVKRFVRDFIDARFSIVELLIPLLVVSLVLGYVPNAALRNASAYIMMITLLFVIIDLAFVVVRLRRQLHRRFPGESLSGTTFYAVTRSMQMRFMRLPKARVKVGQTLPEDYTR